MDAHGTVIDWKSGNAADFGKVPLRFQHKLQKRPEFSDGALAQLLENLARPDYQVSTMDLASHDVRHWRDGELGRMPGADVIEAVRTGQIWIQIHDIDKLNPHYRDLLNEIYADIRAHVPGFKTSREKMRLLISSPNIHVYYHCDVPGQTLWQLRGQKRVYVYPNRPPFLAQSTMEQIALREADEFIQYQDRFDDSATVFDLAPGEMLHWPLNAPHRIVNGNCLNVSFTTEHFTVRDRRMFYVNYANGVLRKTLGRDRLSQKVTGPAFWAKLGVAAAYKLAGEQKKRRKLTTVDFVVDPRAAGSVRDIPGYKMER